MQHKINWLRLIFLVEPEVVIKAFYQTNGKFQLQFSLDLILCSSLD